MSHYRKLADLIAQQCDLPVAIQDRRVSSRLALLSDRQLFRLQCEIVELTALNKEIYDAVQNEAARRYRKDVGGE
jgi:hypothetical protein